MISISISIFLDSGRVLFKLFEWLLLSSTRLSFVYNYSIYSFHFDPLLSDCCNSTLAPIRLTKTSNNFFMFLLWKKNFNKITKGKLFTGDIEKRMMSSDNSHVVVWGPMVSKVLKDLSLVYTLKEISSKISHWIGNKTLFTDLKKQTRHISCVFYDPKELSVECYRQIFG